MFAENRGREYAENNYISQIYYLFYVWVTVHLI
jgi:hypothetical protein